MLVHFMPECHGCNADSTHFHTEHLATHTITDLCVLTAPLPPTVGGCGALIGNFSMGLPNVRGARYLLTLQFAQGSGILAPALAAAADAAALAAAVLQKSSSDAVPMVSA